MASFTQPTRMGINERGALTSVLGGALPAEVIRESDISIMFLDSFFNLLRIF